MHTVFCYVICTLAGSKDAEDAAKYGRFPKRRRISKDQVPLPFVVNQKVTYEERGKEVIKIKAGSDGLAKRQATMELAFAADRKPEEQPKPGLCIRH